MNNLVKPPHERVSIPKYSHHGNDIVNLDRVLRIGKKQECWEPDNEGIPAIIFWFGDTMHHLWFFDRGDEKSRDRTYLLLLEEKVAK